MRLKNRTTSYLVLNEKISVFPNAEIAATDEIINLPATQFFLNREMAELLEEGQAPSPLQHVAIKPNQDSITVGTLEDQGIIFEQPLTNNSARISDLVDKYNNTTGAEDTDLETIDDGLEVDDRGNAIKGNTDIELDQIDAENIIAEDAHAKFRRPYVSKPVVKAEKSFVKNIVSLDAKSVASSEKGQEIVHDESEFITKSSMNAVGATETTISGAVENLDQAAKKLKEDLEEIVLDSTDVDDEVERFIGLGEYEKKKYIIMCADQKVLKKLMNKIADKICKELILQRLKELQG